MPALFETEYSRIRQGPLRVQYSLPSLGLKTRIKPPGPVSVEQHSVRKGSIGVIDPRDPAWKDLLRYQTQRRVD